MIRRFSICEQGRCRNQALALVDRLVGVALSKGKQAEPRQKIGGD
jgi:hypothetical protein